MNTIIIWDQCGEDDIKFAVIDGDHSRLNGSYLNGTMLDPELDEELNRIIFGGNDSGELAVEMLEDFPHEAYTPGKTSVICCGFIP